MGARRGRARLVGLVGVVGLLAAATLTGCGGRSAGTDAGGTPATTEILVIGTASGPAETPLGTATEPDDPPTTEDEAPLTPAEEAAAAAERDALRGPDYVPPEASGLAAGEDWAKGAPGTWADRMPQASAVTMVRRAGPDAVRRALAGHGTVREFPTAAAAQDWVDLRWEDRRWFAVGSRDGVTFAWELFGSNGVDEDVLAPLSSDGVAASFFLNPEDFPWTLVVARAGKVVESTDSDRTPFTGRQAALRIAHATGSAVLSPGWLDGPGVRFFGVQG